MVEEFVEALRRAGCREEKPPENVVHRFRKGDCVVDIYSTGSITFSGKNCSELKELIGEITLKSSGTESRLGCDEAGKGEVFGPLVVACVFADERAMRKLIGMGVKDSKRLSERRILELSDAVKSVAKGSVRVLMPEEYNRLYGRYNNLNRMLDSIYLQMIEKAVKRFKPEKVIVDRFSGTLEGKLRKALGDKVEVAVIPKAEADPAVAAASIVAKAERIKRMRDLEERFKLEIPKGNVNLKPLIERIPKEVIPKVLKLHFRVR